MALPGDMPNATRFWGAAHATPATCKTTSSSTMATCDGDGNGYLDCPSGVCNELFHAWKQLANAALIEGTYTGLTGDSGAWDARVGVNVPAARISNAGYVFWSHSSIYSDGNWFPTQGNLIEFGGQLIGTITSGGVMRPEEAWGIDIKMDDGRPAIGKVRGRPLGAGGNPNCTTSATPSVAEYDLPRTSRECSIHFIF